jgi:hypothetical protein
LIFSHLSLFPASEEPTEGELFIWDSRSKYYWVNREVFVLEKGVLWRKGDEGKSARRVIGDPE